MYDLKILINVNGQVYFYMVQNHNETGENHYPMIVDNANKKHGNNYGRKSVHNHLHVVLNNDNLDIFLYRIHLILNYLIHDNHVDYFHPIVLMNRKSNIFLNTEILYKKKNVKYFKISKK